MSHHDKIKFNEVERLFIETEMTAKEIAQKVDLHISTIYGWAEKHNWQSLMRPQKRDFADLQFQAAVFYIKHGKSADAICKQLDLTMPTLSKWNKAGRWQELRTDTEKLNEYKAADLYINKGSTTGEIGMWLNVPESIVKMWVYVNGWDAARLISQANEVIADVVSAFCSHFITMFPDEATRIEFAKNDYLKNISTKEQFK